MTGQEYINNRALHPFWDESRDPNKEDVIDAFEQGKAEGVKEGKEQLPAELEEAAFTYENDLWESGFKDSGYSPQEVNDAFKAGAEWGAEQRPIFKIKDIVWQANQ